MENRHGKGRSSSQTIEEPNMNHDFCTGKRAELWQRITAFELDDPDARYPFSARLAQENSWTRAYALRVIDEYKRFVYLCMIAPSPPCPSEQVDEAWHLHLTYTRSYWQEFCEQALERPLHHEPTRGGSSEHAKHVALYEQTLAEYRRVFQSEPPADIWPPAAIRFDARHAPRKVDLSRHYVIPKPLAIARAWFGPAAMVGMMIVLPLAANAWNPLDWQGPAFLGFFVVSFVMALIAAFMLRRILVPETDANLTPPLSPTELAHLARGKRGTIGVELWRLLENDSLRIQNVKNEKWGFVLGDKPVIVRGEGPEPIEPLQKRLANLFVSNPAPTMKDIDESAGDLFDKLEANLVNRGLVLDSGIWSAPRIAPFMLMMFVLLVGLSKLAVGMARHKPVGFLILACVVGFFISLPFLLRPIRRSRAGDQLIKDMSEKHEGLKSIGAQGDNPTGVNPAMAVALFGTAALTGTAFAHLASWERRAFGGVSSDSSSSGCSSGCGGGCGGGGCGGCGGGGD